jgi:hypothetical protein
MRKLAGIVCVAGLLGLVGPVRGQDDAQLRDVIAKAIKTQGGADNLNKLKASVSKTKGKFYGMGDGIDYTGETSVQLPNRIRTEVEVEVNGMKFKFVQVVDGDKGWMKLGDNNEDLNKDMLAEAKEQMNVAQISHLTVLTGKDYKLSTLGDSKVGDRPAIGIHVERKGFRDVNLFLDKENSQILKVETRGKDPMNDGKEFTAETFYSDYKMVDGLLIAHKILIKRDGNKYVEAELTEVKVSENLDDGVFAKP